MNKQDKGKHTLVITGISYDRAKELAEEFAGGEMMWVGVENKSVAYPIENKYPTEIIRK